MPQRPLITFEYVIQNVDEDQDGVVVHNNGQTHTGPNNNHTTTNELNSNHLIEQNHGLHQIKIVRSNSNVVGGGENNHHQNYLPKLHQQKHPPYNNYNNQIKNSISTTEVWHHGPR